MADPIPTTDETPRWMAIARLLRPQGRRGEVLAEPLTDVEAAFAVGQPVRFTDEMRLEADAPSRKIEACWRPQGRNAGRVVLKFEGVNSITDAEQLGTRLCLVPEDALPSLEIGTFFVRDLVGCALFDRDRRVGTVTDLQFPTAADGRTRLPDAADLLVVFPEVREPVQAEDKEVEPYLVPFVQAWLELVDLPGRRIVMALPQGLLVEGDEAAEAPPI